MISVALCTYNGEKFLLEQLESIFMQELPVDEIVLCDDGSKDGTLKIVSQFQQKYPGIIKAFENKINLGVVKNFEKAINLCSGEIIFLCDQDDIWFPEKTKEIASFFECNPEKEAVFHDLTLLEPDNETPTSMWQSLYYDPEAVANKSLYKYLIAIGNVVTGAALAIRNKSEKVVFDNLPTSFLHDYQLALSYAKTNTLGLIEKPLGFYRLHENQVIGTSSTAREQNKKKVNLLESSDSLAKLNYWNARLNFWQKLDLEYTDSKAIVDLITPELQLNRNNYLRNLNLLTRTRVVLSWFRSKSFDTKLSDIFLSI